MRVLKELHKSGCRITLFHWNNKYIIKVEQDNLEQIFKVDQFDLAGDEAALAILDELFMDQANTRFQAMRQSIGEAIERG